MMKRRKPKGVNREKEERINRRGTERVEKDYESKSVPLKRGMSGKYEREQVTETNFLEPPRNKTLTKPVTNYENLLCNNF